MVPAQAHDNRQLSPKAPHQGYLIDLPSLAELLSLVKNLRGIVFFTEAGHIRPALGWLKRRFQYRNLGVLPSTIAAVHDSEITKLLSNKPFVQLPIPTPDINNWINLLSASGIAPHVLETVLLASFYIAPILAIGPNSLGCFEQLTLYQVKGPALNDLEAKRHLRILDYAMLDAHAASARLVREVLSDLKTSPSDRLLHSLQALLDRLRTYAEKDGTTRFWRFKQLEGQPVGPVVLYVHVLPALIHLWTTSAPSVKPSAMPASLLNWIDPLFSLITVFRIDESTIANLTGERR